MQVLCIDIGSGTQDILLLDTNQTVENAVQIVTPAPTVRIAKQIEAATYSGESVVLTGETMGGGACTNALMEHLKVGCKAYATTKAALTFHDNLEKVSSWGVELISGDEVNVVRNSKIIRMGDIELDTLAKSLSFWGIVFKPDAIAVAVMDHGAAPFSESQRTFRFQQLDNLLSNSNLLDSLIFTSEDLPVIFSRMQAIKRTIKVGIPLIFMDTGAAAVLGVSVDKTVAVHSHRLVINLGNSHTIAFLLENRRIMGFFEHHTSALSLDKLENLLGKLISADLSQEEIWNDGGHGSLILERGTNPFIVSTGPRRELLISSRIKPYLAAPFGNMMLTGCYGLALGIAIKNTTLKTEIENVLGFSSPISGKD